MPTTKYYVNGNWVDYDELEHYGYTTFPTNSTNFLLCEIGANFGTYDGTNGYCYLDQSGSSTEGYEYLSLYFYPTYQTGWGQWDDINLLATLGVAPQTSLMVWLLDNTNTPVKSLSVTSNGPGSERYFIANKEIIGNNGVVYWFPEADLYTYGFSYPQCYVQLSEVPLDDPDVAVDYLETITGMSYESASAAIYEYVNSGYTTGIGGLKNSLDAALFARLWNENNPSTSVGGLAEAVVANVDVDFDYGYMTDSTDVGVEKIEIDYVGKPKVFYSCTLSEKFGFWGTIEVPETKRGYLRSAVYQSTNKSVSANSNNFLYGQGESTTLYGVQYHTYQLLKAYNAAGVEVSTEGAKLALVSSGGLWSLRLLWGPTAASFCYVEFLEFETVFRLYTLTEKNGFGVDRTIWGNSEYDLYERGYDVEASAIDGVDYTPNGIKYYQNVRFYRQDGSELPQYGNYSGSFYSLILSTRDGIVTIKNGGTGYVPVSCVEFKIIINTEE